MVVLLAAFGMALIQWNDVKDVTAAMGPITGIIAALVGAYFGIRGAPYAALATNTPPPSPPGGGGEGGKKDDGGQREGAGELGHVEHESRGRAAAPGPEQRVHSPAA